MRLTAPTTVPTDRYLDLPSGRVRYWREGVGPPIIFVHGLGSSVETWEANVTALADRYTACALDLPGFGRSERGSMAFTLPSAAQFLRDAIDALGLERVHVVGNSMGGVVALKFALDFPQRIDRLVLIASGGIGREVAMTLRLASLPFVDRLLRNGMRKEQAEAALRGVFADSSMLTPDYVARSVELIRQPRAMAAFREAVLYGINIFGQRRHVIQCDRLSEISAPALIIWGDRDRVIPVAHAHIAARHLRDARLAILPGCGHCPQVERGAEVNGLLEQFLTP